MEREKTMEAVIERIQKIYGEIGEYLQKLISADESYDRIARADTLVRESQELSKEMDRLMAFCREEHEGIDAIVDEIMNHTVRIVRSMYSEGGGSMVQKEDPLAYETLRMATIAAAVGYVERSVEALSDSTLALVRLSFTTGICGIHGDNEYERTMLAVFHELATRGILERMK